MLTNELMKCAVQAKQMQEREGAKPKAQKIERKERK